MENKKGITSFALIGFIFMCLMVLIGIASLSFGMGELDTAMSSIGGKVGVMDFNETYNEFMKPGVIAAKTTVPRNIGIGTLLGMVIMLMIFGWAAPAISQIWILLDILVIIVSEILAVYIKDSFVLFMNSTPQITSILQNELASSSAFVLSLPLIVPTVGVLLMVITHMRVKKISRLDGGELR